MTNLFFIEIKYLKIKSINKVRIKLWYLLQI